MLVLHLFNIYESGNFKEEFTPENILLISTIGDIFHLDEFGNDVNEILFLVIKVLNFDKSGNDISDLQL